MTLADQQIDNLTAIVGRIMRIDDVRWDGSGQNFHVRYRGRLLFDSLQAYNRLAESLRHLDVTPWFRKEGEQHLVILSQSMVKRTSANIRTNLLLFALTVFSVLLAGAFYNYEGTQPQGFLELYVELIRNLGDGLPFAVSILAILLAHEFGHYLAGRYHKTSVTLPYFIPLPFLGSFGTLGAFIRLNEPPKNKRVLLDIGIAGPLAGLVVAIPVLLIGLSLSQVEPIPSGQGLLLEGNSVLYLLAKYAVFGQWLPAPASYGGTPELLYWIRYYFTGLPAPVGGTDVFIHSVAWAGWAGLLVTALNLIPAGQLDGGHLIFTLWGRRSRALLPFILGALAILGVVWSGWWLWAFLIFSLGRTYAEPLDQITALDPRRKAIAIFGLIVFFLVFTPVPLRVFSFPP